MRDARRGLGRRGEQIAARYLAENGYLVVDENWRCSAGELDLVARQGPTLVCVEVRTRRGDRLGSPEESITAVKRQRLIALAEAYIEEHSWGGDWRIDMIAVEMDGRGQLLRVDHYENAVTG